MGTVIYHNPDCGTSRNVLEILKGFEANPTVIEYLECGWTKEQLLGLFAAADLSARQALRVSKSPAEELGLTDTSVDDETLLNAMVEYPVLVNRPIVCTSKGVRLCRPSEAVFALMDVPSGSSFVKEDGEVVTAP